MLPTILSSSRIEDLLTALADELKRDDDLFNPPLILAPNGNLRKWLKMELAKTTGISAGLDIRFLETGLAERLYGKDASEPLTDDLLAILVYALLSASEKEKSLKPLHDYCIKEAVPDASRRWQLSVQLAGIFRDYGLQRHELTEQWLDGRDMTDGAPDPDGIYAAQAALYRKIFGKDGLLDTINERRTGEDGSLPLKSLVCSSPETMEPGTSVHVFGFSSISPRHFHILKELNRNTDLHFYFLSPDPVADAGATDLENVRKLWGKAAEVNRCLIEKNFALQTPPDMEKPGADSMLEKLQAALSSGQMPAPGQADESIRITGCPGIHREVETVYQQILHEMENEDNKLQLTDIAVLTTDIQEYLPAILSIFEGRREHGYRLPFNLSDTSAYEESVYGQGLLALLSLTESGLSRRDVFSLIHNPAVQARWNISEQTASVWADWTEGLHICRDADGKGKSWPFGLERLRLGRIMSMTEDNPDGFAGRQPWGDLHSSDPELTGRFSLFIEHVIDTERQLRTDRTARGWQTTIEGMMRTFLEIPRDRTAETHVRTGIEAALDSLQILDTAMTAAGTEEQVVPLPVVRDYLKKTLRGIPVTRGQYLTGGVTVSSLLPMRPVPFRHVYILGLQEGSFPGREESNVLDLRHANPDRDGTAFDLDAPDLNRALFLETLLCTREKLFLSFVDRDLQKDREFFPCSTLNRLRLLLREIFHPDGEFPVVHTPHMVYPPAYIGKNDRLPNYSPLDRLLCLDRLQAQGRLEKKPPESTLSKYRPSISMTVGEQEENKEEITVSIRDLEVFLKNPGKARAGRHIRQEIDPEQDTNAVLHPDLFSGYDVRDALVDKMIEMVFTNDPDIDPFPELRQLYENRLSAAQMTPDGPFRPLDWKNRHRELVMMLEGSNNNGIRKYREQTIDKYTRFNPARLSGKEGSRDTPDVLDIRLDTICLKDGPNVRIRGFLPWVLRSEDDTKRAMITRQFGNNDRMAYATLIPTLFALAEQELGGNRENPCQEPEIVLFGNEKTAGTLFRPGVVSNRDYIKTLVADYLAPDPPENLPLEAVITYLRIDAPKFGRSKIITPEHLRKSAPGFTAGFRAFMEENKDDFTDSWLELTGAEIPDDAGEIILRRLLPLFEIHNGDKS